jgi:hypothetical protein
LHLVFAEEIVDLKLIFGQALANVAFLFFLEVLCELHKLGEVDVR